MAFTLTSGAPALVIGGPPRVNLMPRAEVERRQRNGLLRRWLWGLVAALAVVVLAVAAAFVLQAAAAVRLVTEQARTTTLLSQIAELQPVSKKIALQDELSGFRSQAMATDLVWSNLVGAVEPALPAGVSLTGFALVPGGAPVGDDPTAELGASGQLTLTSTAPTEIVAVVRSLRGVPGIRTVDVWSAQSDEAGFAYTLRITYDQSFYTGAYAAEVTE